MNVVIGVDSGGSKTRAIAVSLDGEIVGYGEGGGGNPGHDSAYCQNIHAAILSATEKVGVGNVIRIVAGIAGLDRPEDINWAKTCTAVPGVNCPQVQINDADIAHFGAFSGGPGIVSIQGDGSMIFGITETGRRVRNFDFRHYARAAGPWMGATAVLAMLARGHERGDDDFVSRVLEYWSVGALSELREIAIQFDTWPHQELMRKQGDMASLVTDAAENGSPLAASICDEGAYNVTDGIRLLGRLFGQQEVSIALIGSCVRSK